MDEAGRGPLAGPVVAAAVCFPKALLEKLLEGSFSTQDHYLTQVQDSKKLSPQKRKKIFLALQADTRVLKAVGVVHEQTIDQVNIYQATLLAMKQAISQITPPSDHILVDGHPIPHASFSQQGIVQGDQKSLSIAAASIIAKVFRDNIMMHYDLKFPQYHFRAHKGYGTEDHLKQIAQHGPCPIHRRSFAPFRALHPKE